MIRINLLGEKPDYGPIYMLQGLLFVGIMSVATFSCFVFHQALVSDYDSLEADKIAYEGQLAKLKDRTKRVEELEQNKQLLRTKLTTIAKLKMNKSGPVHILAELTEAIPERAWVTGASQKSETMEIRGMALDPQTVSNFMRKLEESPSFGDVDLVYSKQMMRENVPIQEFSLMTKLENPLAQQRLQQAIEKDAKPAPAAKKAPKKAKEEE